MDDMIDDNDQADNDNETRDIDSGDNIDESMYDFDQNINDMEQDHQDPTEDVKEHHDELDDYHHGIGAEKEDTETTQLWILKSQWQALRLLDNNNLQGQQLQETNITMQIQ